MIEVFQSTITINFLEIKALCNFEVTFRENSLLNCFSNTLT